MTNEYMQKHKENTQKNIQIKNQQIEYKSQTINKLN